MGRIGVQLILLLTLVPSLKTAQDHRRSKVQTGRRPIEDGGKPEVGLLANGKDKD